MIWIALVSYDTTRPKTDRRAYCSTISEFDGTAAEMGRLQQIGAVTNDVVTYMGFYDTEAEARAAVEAYISAP